MDSTIDLHLLLRELTELRATLLEHERALAPELEVIPEEGRAGARNLVHYIALRRYDLRRIQLMLVRLGLSSLGRAEANVMATLDAVIGILERLTGLGSTTDVVSDSGVAFEEDSRLLRARTDALLGPEPTGRRVRVMVTMPGEAASNYDLIRDLMLGGMNCMRINCAHDGPLEWARMVAHARAAEVETGLSCRVLVDLAGPKIRTGAVEPGPRVVKVRPQRNELGRPVVPATVWLTCAESPVPTPDQANAVVPVEGKFLDVLRSGDRIGLRDARGAARFLTLVCDAEGGWIAESMRTIYIHEGATLTLIPPDREPERLGVQGTVTGLPPRSGEILLEVGDRLLLTAAPLPGVSAVRDLDGGTIEPARISCTFPELFGMVRPGERIWFDDGKIGGIIRSVRADHIDVEIVYARPGGSRLYADKGINLPDSQLRFSPLTAKDREDLRFIARSADAVGYSFVQSALDVAELQSELAAVGRSDMGIVLKIETKRAFEQLPNMLLAAMRSPNVGVMIARGDLAIECGYERLAEVQEEILWLCEAAHLPVIWATQVLEGLTKHGQPSRPEITDAAMGERAECVMLNKGPYIVDAVHVLDDILRRMQAHQQKKRSMLRRLKLADGDLMMVSGGRGEEIERAP